MEGGVIHSVAARAIGKELAPLLTGGMPVTNRPGTLRLAAHLRGLPLSLQVCPWLSSRGVGCTR